MSLGNAGPGDPQVATFETRSVWSTFFSDLVAHSGRLATSDAYAALVMAIAANLPGAGMAA